MPRRYRYQLKHSFADRKAESLSLHERYPEHVPIICEPAPHSGPVEGYHRVRRELDCSKFILPRTAAMQHLTLVLRDRLLLPEEQGLFFFVNDSMPPNSACIGDLYAQKKDLDGFLYVTYCVESTFGAF